MVNILLGSFGSAPAFVGDLERMVHRLPQGSEWAAARIGSFQRPMTVATAIMDGSVRIVLEADATGSPAWSNVEAVQLAVRAAEPVGRSAATHTETRRRFRLAVIGEVRS